MIFVQFIPLTFSEYSRSRQLLLDMDSYYCLFCPKEVTSRQEALLCDGRDRWQHRQCQTGITREQYREAVRSGLDVIRRCLYCSASSTPIAESTRLSYEDMDAFDIPGSFEIENEQAGMATFSICKFAVRHNYAMEFDYIVQAFCRGTCN